MIYLMFTGPRDMVIRDNRREIYSDAEVFVLQMNEIEPVHLISGMAEGWDEACAKIGMRNEIPYTVVIPNVSYGRYYWGQHSLTGENRIGTYNELVDGATEKIYLEKLYGAVISGEDAGVRGKMAGAPGYMVDGYWVMANFQRNQVMVDKCDRGAVLDAESSGTKDAVIRLKRARKPFYTYPFVQLPV